VKEQAALPPASDAGPVVVDSARAYHLDQNAIAAETRAAKAEESMARDARRGVPVNPELRAKFEQRQAVKEVAARELRDHADRLRSIADEAKAKNVPPGGKSSMPEGVEYIPPPKTEAPPAGEAPIVDAQVKAPKRRPPGADLSDVVKNLDSRIKELSKPTSAGGTSESRAIAEKLQEIRDKFVLENQGGSRFSPSKFLRSEMTGFQKKGFGKGMAGDEAATARIAANREASKAVGDVIIKHVTGMDYATAKAAAAADPTSVAAKLFKANPDVEISNLIEAHLHAKQGPLAAALRCRVTLPVGGYYFSGHLRATNSSGQPVRTRLTMLRYASSRFDVNRQTFNASGFDLPVDVNEGRTPEEIQFDCEISGESSDAWLDARSFTVTEAGKRGGATTQ
jgi:hypothetical protein